MNKNQKTILIVILLILLGLFGYFFVMNKKSNNTKANPDTVQSSKTENKMSVSDKFKGTFMELLKKGQNYSCTFDNTDPKGNTTKGSVYVASGGSMISGTFEYKPNEGAAITSNVIRDDKYNYIWVPDKKQGFKTAIDPNSDSLFSKSSKPAADTTTKDNNTNVGVNDNTQIDFDCKPWIVDKSKFTPPSDVEFVDFSEQMKQVQETMKQNPQVNCSICDQAPEGDARTQCKKSLGC